MLIEKKITLCFIGNPNVGKSTLINRLLNSNKLKTSEDPGTTKKIIEKDLLLNQKIFGRSAEGLDLERFVFLDTAGVYKKKILIFIF